MYFKPWPLPKADLHNHLNCCNKGKIVGQKILFLVASGNGKLSSCSLCVLPSRWPGLRLLGFQIVCFQRELLSFAKGPKLAELGPFDASTSSGSYLPQKFYAQKGKNKEDIQLQDKNEICHFLLSTLKHS